MHQVFDCVILETLTALKYFSLFFSVAPISHRGRKETDCHSDKPDTSAGQQLVSFVALVANKATVLYHETAPPKIGAVLCYSLFYILEKTHF